MSLFRPNPAVRNLMKLVFAFWRVSLVLLVSALFVAGATAAVEPPLVTTSAVESTVTLQETSARANFRIKVENGEETSLTNVWVFFSDGSSVSAGDIAAGKSAVTDAVERTIELSGSTTQNLPVHITLKFLLNGAEVEMPSAISLAVK